MSTLNPQIRAAIDSFDIVGARELLRDGLKDANAETYYLASRVALDDVQKKYFLNAALTVDVFHEESNAALRNLNLSTGVPVPLGYAKTQATAVANPTSTSRDVAYTVAITHIKINGNSYPLSGFGRRILAEMIDTIMRILLLLLPLFALVGMMLLEQHFGERGVFSSIISSGQAGVLAGGVLYLIVFSYYNYVIPVRHWPGQTFGKKLMKLRVLMVDGSEYSLGTAVFRPLIGYWISGLVFGLGYFWAIFDPRRQTWHDKLFNTVVVKVVDSSEIYFDTRRSDKSSVQPNDRQLSRDDFFS